MPQHNLTSVRRWCTAATVPLALSVLATGSSAAASDMLAASGDHASARVGVYAGPAQRGVEGAKAYSLWAGAAVTQVLDFAASDSWSNVTGPAWLLAPHSKTRQRLEYSLPLVLDNSGSLKQCAAGAYNGHWLSLGKHLVAAQLSNSIVRPGWEFNGDWYRWTAVTNPEDYVACFRNVVTTLRSVAHQAFRYDWSLNVSRNALAAEKAYPGDAYVDYVGVDVYDYSWTNYPASNNGTFTGLKAAQLKTWQYILNGDHGLKYWRIFAAQHAKPMAISEWGLASRPDGHGGLDDPTYVAGMMDFVDNPANNVSYEQYFDVAQHSVNDSRQLFPYAARLLQQLQHRQQP